MSSSVSPAGYKRKTGRASYVTIKTDDEIAPQMRITISEKRNPRPSPRVQSTKPKNTGMSEGPSHHGWRTCETHAHKTGGYSADQIVLPLSPASEGEAQTERNKLSSGFALTI